MIFLVFFLLLWLRVAMLDEQGGKDNPVLECAFFAIAVAGTARLLLG